MTDERAVDGLVAETVAAHGRLDIMICNAGGSASTTYPPHASVAEFVETFGPGPPAGRLRAPLVVPIVNTFRTVRLYIGRPPGR